MPKPTKPEPSRAIAQGGSGNPGHAIALVLRPLSETTQALRLTVESETAALKRSDFAAFARIQAEKMDRMRCWNDAVADLRNRREEFSGMAGDLRARMEALQQELSAAFRENLAAIDRANRSVNRLHGRIMTIARREVEDRNRVTYSKTGKVGGNHRKALSMGLTETA